MDIVYTYRYEKRSQNRQLRYSLRSIEKHLIGVGEVFVIGFPCGMKGVRYIEHHDNFSAARNIMMKLQIIARTEEVSEDFLYIADDHYLLKSMEAKDYPYYVNGMLQDLYKTQNNAYRAMIKNTYEALELRQLPTLNYNIHTPIIYNKTKLRKLAEMYDLNNPLNYLLKSLYMNTFHGLTIEPELQELKDCKIRTNFEPEEIKSRIAARTCWSTGKESYNENIGKVLEELYPNKSKYEH